MSNTVHTVTTLKNAKMAKVEADDHGFWLRVPPMPEFPEIHQRAVLGWAAQRVFTDLGVESRATWEGSDIRVHVECPKDKRAEASEALMAITMGAGLMAFWLGVYVGAQLTKEWLDRQ